MPSAIEEIKSRLNIVDIAGGYLKLEKAGGNFKACCPFHNEKTASFFISPSRQTYHCFGCSRGGDIISFVEEIEGLDFPGALKVLADRAGVTLTREKLGVKDDRAPIYTALELATKFYEAVLPKFPEAEKYLHARGLTPETIKRFRVGFAPDEWRSLGDFLAKKGVTQQVMEQAGLVVRSPQGYYDRFRGRIMFPITDSSGRVIAFSGRILKEGEGKTLGASASAKYVNSPETEVFHKSRALFGFSQAKDAIRHAQACVLVEGQMDLILSHQAGIANAVASSGTALTSEHLDLIKRFTKNLILAFDADDAGIAAAHRGIELALSQDMSVRIAAMPHGLDPADMVRKDPAEWVHAVQNAKQVIDFYLDLLPERSKDKTTLRAKVSEIVIPLIALLKNSNDQGHYTGEVAKLLGIKEDFVWEEVKKYARTMIVGTSTKSSQTAPPPVSRRARIGNLIYGILVWQEGEKTPLIKNIPEYRKRLEKLEKGPPQDLSPNDAIIFEVETRFQGNEQLEKELQELFREHEKEILKETQLAKLVEIQQARSRGDSDRESELLIEYNSISKELETLKSNK